MVIRIQKNGEKLSYPFTIYDIVFHSKTTLSKYNVLDTGGIKMNKNRKNSS